MTLGTPLYRCSCLHEAQDVSHFMLLSLTFCASAPVNNAKERHLSEGTNFMYMYCMQPLEVNNVQMCTF